MLFVGLKTPKNWLRRPRAPETTGEAYTAFPYLQLVERGTRCPLLKNPTPASALRASNFGPSGRASSLLMSVGVLLPARCHASAIISRHRVSVCVCLVTRRYCIKTAKRRITQTWHSGPQRVAHPCPSSISANRKHCTSCLTVKVKLALHVNVYYAQFTV